MDGFFQSLKIVKLDNVFNPWFCQDKENDIDSGSPAIRLSQLRQYLLERQDAKYLLVGEALGYQGGHFTGIAMMSERILLGKMRHKSIMPRHVFSGIEPRRTSMPSVKKDGFTEPTATIVWERLITSGFDMRDFIIWNAFPWHPYKPEIGILSNRTPSEIEFEKGKPAMLELLKSVNVSKIIAVGEKSRVQLREMDIDALMVRHPANGGASKFREQIIQAIKK
ncbi:parvulin-like peptidyl-prolyl isomerase [Candidatus Scalindua japonica]|uniref:Parvulin-like peptidyl-prolyl isomerase n=2 Tax=Candidatus Scalindua japonica TaxID=1284222 RepID=A0A286TYT9_9BACT|nr:parvulin-like peptidyl-prolyl isomerase [Candidatus Scalindua japonica]